MDIVYHWPPCRFRKDRGKEIRFMDMEEVRIEFAGDSRHPERPDMPLESAGTFRERMNSDSLVFIPRRGRTLSDKMHVIASFGQLAAGPMEDPSIVNTMAVANVKNFQNDLELTNGLRSMHS
jgi:hypothetical protein